MRWRPPIFSEKSEAMCQFFDEWYYPVYGVQAVHPEPRPTNWSTENATNSTEGHISITSKQFRDWYYLFATSPDFIQTRLKKICNFFVGSSFQTNDQTRTFTCARSRCKTRTQYMAVCGLPLHLGSLESRKTLEQKVIFQIGILNPHGINECSSFTYFIFRETCISSCHERGTKKKFWVPMRNRTSYLRIPCSDALPLSHGERGPLRSSYNTRPAYC